LSRDAPALTALLQAVGTKLLLTPAMSADILMLVKVTHITCCGGTYSFCEAIPSRELAKLTFGPASGGAVHCLLLYAV
jgi:hypothetical protein